MADVGLPMGLAEMRGSLLDHTAPGSSSPDRAAPTPTLRPAIQAEIQRAELAFAEPSPRTPDAVLAVDLAGRRFLIVTAPFGPFSRRLADTLRARGATVSRMLFNAGDQLDWGTRNGVTFHEPISSWPARFLTLATGYTDVIVFGEGGAYNQAVLTQGADCNARVWVLENGYFRPDWITVERDGVNARTSLPRTRAGYAGPLVQTPTPTPVRRILPHHVLNISLYHLIQLPGRFLYPRYARPYTQPPWLQCAGHIRRYFSLALASRASLDAATISARGPFFVVCLQREGDVQLLRYSRFADNTAFLAELMTSFARFAPADARLVVKNHPLDPGLIDQGDIVRCLAVERGLAGRVDFIDGGNLAQLCRASRGMVVNNSSAALSALGFQTPVKVLGQAFFDFDGLTDQQPLDGFWSDPRPPETELFNQFRAQVIARTQVNGNFHDPKAMTMTVEGLADVFQNRADETRSPPDHALHAQPMRQRLRIV